MENFMELCRSRRSYRKYTEEPVSDEDLQYILRCALMAPAGKRLNPWEFFVVRDREQLKRLTACRTYGTQMFDTAAAGIVVALDKTICDTWMADGAIAAEHILLAAADRGLGACWCHVYERVTEGEDGATSPAEVLVKEVAGVPENLTVLCVISVGHKNEERKDFQLEKLQYAKVHGVDFGV